MAQGGPKLGAKVADVVVRAVGDHKRRRDPELVRLAMAIQHAFFELTGSEHRATTGGLFVDLLNTGELTGWGERTARFLAEGHGQWQTMLAGQATGMAMGSGLMSVLQNEFAPAIQGVLASNPHGLLSPADLAALVARNRLDYDTGSHEAGKSGLANVNFSRLVKLNYVSPNVDEIVALYQRGLITSDIYIELLNHIGWDPQFVDYPFLLGKMLPTPQELATLVTFGAIDQDQARNMAGQAGMDGTNFDLLVAGNGQPPSTEDLLFAYRRKIIDKARLLRGITQGPVRNEWFDVIESLGSVPMSTADAIDAAVQGHLTIPEAQTIAGQNGLLPAHFGPLYETAGSPPGAEAMVTYWRRGLMTEADVRQGLTETRLKPKYVNLILSTRNALLPMVTIREAYGHGTITHDRALILLGQHGYTAQDADAILATAAATKTATARKLTEAQAVELYEQGAITLDACRALLESLGYTRVEADELVHLADLNRQRTLVNAAVSRIRSAYVSRRISVDQAQADLDVLLIPGPQQDYLFALWNLELAADVKTLSLAQCGAALKKGIIGGDEFRARVSAMGYPDADVAILGALYGPAQAPTARG